MVHSSILALAVAVTYHASHANAASFCDAAFTGSSVCLAEFTSTSSVTYRIGVADAATDGAAFDTLLHIVAPVATGWAGLAWGGAMTNNPLTVGWPSSDNSAIVSSRWATGHTLPAAYTGASYTTLSSSKNSTHWALSVVCSGCSQWSGASLAPSTANTIAWASSTRAVTTPSSNTSTFGYHTGRGTVTVDLTAARVPQAVFDQYVAFLSGNKAGAPVAPSSPSSVPAPPSSTPAPPSSTPAPPSSTPAPSAPPSSSASAPVPPPVSSPAVPPAPPTLSTTIIHSSTTAVPPPPPASSVSGTGSITTVLSTVYITVTPPAANPPSPTSKIGTTRPSPTTSRTIGTPPWVPSAPKPVPTEGGDDGSGEDTPEPTITVTVIEGGNVPSGAPEPPIGHPTGVVGGKKKIPPFVPPFRRPPPFGIPGWA
ncbi:hypothetical protein SEUCBS139899_007621 [Sporothrix eucalyptigena]